MKQLTAIVVVAVFLVIIACSNAKSSSSGESLYKANCANCHMNNGEGLGELMPPIKGTDYFTRNRQDLACIIQNGMSGEIVVNGTTYNNQMLAFPDLSEVDIVNILNYIQGRWYAKEDSFTVSEIKEQLKNCN